MPLKIAECFELDCVDGGQCPITQTPGYGKFQLHCSENERLNRQTLVLWVAE